MTRLASEDATPLTMTLKRLALEEAEAEVITLAVLVATPFTLLVRVLPEMLLVVVETRAVVAETPFTVVVKVLPESDVVSELMTFAKRLETPLTMVAKVLVVVESVLLVMALEVARMPLTVEEMTLPAVERRLVVTARGIEVVEMTPLTVEVKIPVEVA